jgi:hypothetical protein
MEEIKFKTHSTKGFEENYNRPKSMLDLVEVTTNQNVLFFTLDWEEDKLSFLFQRDQIFS